MSGDIPGLSLSPYEQRRFRLIEEIAANTMLAQDLGSDRLIPALLSLESLGLDGLDRGVVLEAEVYRDYGRDFADVVVKKGRELGKTDDEIIGVLSSIQFSMPHEEAEESLLSNDERVEEARKGVNYKIAEILGIEKGYT